MDIANLQFTAQLLPMVAPINACNGCLFSNEKVSVCREVCRIAVAAGLPDCDSEPSGKRVIYVLPETDPRQISIFDLTVGKE